MASMDIAISRNLLNQIRSEVKAQGKRVMKDAWVYGYPNDLWEFHGPDGFYWHGNCTNAYEARYDGWSAWLKHVGARKDD